MTFISDLAARAIAFITAVQTALVNTYIDNDGRKEIFSILTIAKHTKPALQFARVFEEQTLKRKLRDRATELVGMNKILPNKKTINVREEEKEGSEKSETVKDLNESEEDLKYKMEAVEYTLKICSNLVTWINSNWENNNFNWQDSEGGFPSPYKWRIIIEKILYEHPKERVTLAIALQYLPIQIVLAVGGADYSAGKQRALQIWSPDKESYKLLLKLLDKNRALRIYPEDLVWEKLVNFEQAERNLLLSNEGNNQDRIDIGIDDTWNNWIKGKEDENNKLLGPLLKPEDGKMVNKIQELDKLAKVKIIELLLSHSKIIAQLLEENAPLSFELIFAEELKEITANRAKRREEERITNKTITDSKENNKGNELVTGDGNDPIYTNDHRNKNDESKTNDQSLLNENDSEIFRDRKNPFEQVQDDRILALAFSGGGIRSATFNLGILQGFADKKLIGQFDYLSTVSGGGYIGSWLTSWIQRNQSVVKVSNRLSTVTSPDPTGAELKPIKWLRMYSNYFAPNASIMSIDSWTIGVTWLRNTILNQVVIFLFFLSLLFAGNLLYHIWSAYLVHNLSPSWQEILGWSTILLVPVALLSTIGMRDYPKDRSFPFTFLKFKFSIIQGIIGLSLLGAYFISAWLSSGFLKNGIPLTSPGDKLLIFWPVAVIAFLCLFAVGVFGGYVTYIQDSFKKNVTFKPLKARGRLLLMTLFSVLFGWICIVLVSILMETLPVLSLGSDNFGNNVLQFILGVPLTLEVFALAIVVRMGLLGKYFPDERREWWGRIGAYIHRLCFLWILVSTSALLGWTFIQYAFNNYAAPSIAATGGWVALVGACVKAAFSAKSTGEENEKGAYASFLKVLSMVGPYLFILGLLILLPALTTPMLSLAERLTVFSLFFSNPIIQNLVVLVACFVCSLLLASLLGVNEFSMYNFYKNRLVRAYLGGTRRSTTRQKTANPFTGFDMEDDILLHKFSNEEGYHGPYQILNCALNASEGQELDRQDRKAESFIFSPLYCGFDFSMARDPTDEKKSYDYAYRKTVQYAFPGEGPLIGTAMAISGAAINPNHGYHSSPQIAFLLTIFNAQMGRWLGNPRKSKWQESDPRAGLLYMINDLVNKTTTSDNFVSLSDGGHFDNMGLYELVRRKCPLIILCDAEQDERFTCEGFANAVRRCRIDFGAEIDIDISKITARPDERHSLAHYAIGNIRYVGENKSGVLLYIKSSITGHEPVDVFEYALKNKTFPHQTTGDQFFDEEQFESYRRLGLHIAAKILADKEVVDRFHFDIQKSVQEGISAELADPFVNLYSKFKKLFSGI